MMITVMTILTCSAPESSSRQQQQQIADNSVISVAMTKTMTKTMIMMAESVKGDDDVNGVRIRIL